MRIVTCCCSLVYSCSFRLVCRYLASCCVNLSAFPWCSPFPFRLVRTNLLSMSHILYCFTASLYQLGTPSSTPPLHCTPPDPPPPRPSPGAVLPAGESALRAAGRLPRPARADAGRLSGPGGRLAAAARRQPSGAAARGPGGIPAAR